ncbi:MAG: transcriptional coactivator p15/PC4 family protein [Candidatus Helarchaeota archaeon]
MENQNKLIDQFHKNSQELIEIHITKWKAQDYVDIRIWMLPDPVNEKERQPTKKGICINADLLPKLIKALEKAKKVLEKPA